LYDQLPAHVRTTADENFEILKSDPRHPSLHLKRVGVFWSVRVGIAWRALAVQHDDTFVWFWIGSHADYDKLTKRS
jgi:hypothetical protein